MTRRSADPYIITAADAEAGTVINTAGATSVDPADKSIQSNQATSLTATQSEQRHNPHTRTAGPHTDTAGNLPNTGAPILDTLQAGIGLICIGTAMVLGARLRRHRRRA